MSVKKYSYSWLIFFICCGLVVNSTAQIGLTNNGAILKIMPTTDLKINNGGLINQANGSIDNQGNIYLDLDWLQTGLNTIYSGNGWIVFEGSTNQYLSASTPLTIAGLQVNNSNRLILNTTVNISNQVNLTNNGKIELGINNLALNAGSTIVNFDANNFIITNSTGILQQHVGAINTIFPIGNSSYNPATINNSGTTDNFKLRVFDQVLLHGTSGLIQTSDFVNRTWLIEEETIGGSNITTTFQWNTADELPAFDRTNSGVSHHLSGSLWDNPPYYAPANNVGTATWTQTRSGFTSFSPFVVRDFNAELPVELLSFKANRLNRDMVDLTWVTASETNNKGFQVERMLDNETNFSTINWVNGLGTTTTINTYQLEDLNPHKGISYYRLKQIDFDGSSHYSPIRSVAGYASKNQGNILVYPIPAINNLNINFSNWKQGSTKITLKIIDVQGRILFHQIKNIQQNTLLKLPEVQELLPGTYYLTITADSGESFVKKFTKNEE